MVSALVLHGFTGSGAAITGLIDRLDQPCVAPDLPGHGAAPVSAAPDGYSMAAMVEAATAALDETPADVIGYSMGARVALSLAVARSRLVRRLSLIGGTAGIENPIEAAARRAADEHLADTIERDGVEAFVDRWERLPLFAGQQALPEPARAAIRRGRLGNSAPGLAGHLRAAGTGAMPSLWTALPDLDLPVQLIVGEHDAKFTAIARDMAARLPDAEVVVIGGAGHAAHTEDPDSVAAAINDFWTRR